MGGSATEALVLEPLRAEAEGVAEEETAQGAPGVEGAPVSEPIEARDEGTIAVVPVSMAQGSVVAVVELPDSSEEYGDSMDIDPAAAASAAAHIAEFASASADVLEAGTSEGCHHGAIVPSGLPLEFLRKEQEEEEAWNAQLNVGREILQTLDRAFQLHQNTDYQVSQVNTSPPKIARIRFNFYVSSPTSSPLQQLREISREKSAEMTRLYSQMRQLGQHNAELVLKNIEANTRMADLGVRQQALEEDLARVADERDAQKAAAEQNVREAEA